MRVMSMSVKGLFGVFDHEIPLKNAERVTIIHGPNGFGKTVMLRMIAAVADGSRAIFENTPFNEFCLSLDDGTSRIIRRHLAEKPEGGPPVVELEFLFRDAGGALATVSTPERTELPPLPESVLHRIDKFVPSPLRVSEGGWVDGVSGRRYSVAQVLEKYPKAAAAVPAEYRGSFFFGTSEELVVFFVETNRLGGGEPPGLDRGLSLDEQIRSELLFRNELSHGDRPSRIVPRVKQYSEDIVQRIRFVLADYAKHSQESDRTFPERLVRFERDGYSALPERDILDQMAELETKRRRLITLGLLDSETGLRDLTEEDLHRAREALTIYVRDVQEKLKVFDDIAHRIGSLMDIVNDRFKYKHLRIDRMRGFRVLSDQDEASIQIEDLSSGEQHELVVLYELLFRAPKNGLVLVDEPEISLHVAWQSRFLSDLIGILRLTDAYAIVATHSPVIIGTRQDLTVELKGPAVAR